MGFLDELKKLTRPYAEDEEDDFDDYDDDYEDEEVEEPAAAPRVSRAAEKSAPTTDRRGNKVVNIHTTAQMQVVLVKPERFDSVSEIAEHLRARCAVVLNLEAANKDVARRLVDFLSGCAYALDGKIKKVAMSTYIITPYNVDIVGDLVEELENNGMYF
ncbi:MAG: cell division protein SepF [Ruminococcaceae bacterium]|nr:cell division protein SepF [Oscillospiraceae bacterium]